MLHLGKVQLVA